jgi:hypothetical protein
MFLYGIWYYYFLMLLKEKGHWLCEVPCPNILEMWFCEVQQETWRDNFSYSLSLDWIPSGLRKILTWPYLTRYKDRKTLPDSVIYQPSLDTGANSSKFQSCRFDHFRPRYPATKSRAEQGWRKNNQIILNICKPIQN